MQLPNRQKLGEVGREWP